MITLDRVDVIGEEVGDRLATDAIALVLEPMDLDPVGCHVLEALELLERLDELLALLHHDGGLLLDDRGRLLDPIEDAGVGYLLDEVEDVVEPRDEPVDVLPIERGDECVLQLVPDVVAELVAALLEVDQLAGEPLTLVVGAEELVEHARGREDVLGVLDEHVEELFLARDERKTHCRVCLAERGGARMLTACYAAVP